MKRPAWAWLFLVWLFLAAAAHAGIPVGGLVQDTDGKPIQGAEVRLVPLPSRIQRWKLELSQRSHPEPVARASSDAQGRFRIMAPEAGMWQVVVAAPGRAPRQHSLVPLMEPGELPPVRLPAATDLEVRVMGSKGQPVAGARLWITSHREPPRPGAFDPSAEAWSPASGTAVTGTDGKAAVEVARGERVTVAAVAPGFLPGAVAGDGRQRSFRVSLEPGCERVLEVLDDRRRPLEGVVAQLDGWARDASNAAGRLAVAVPCGKESSMGLETGDGRGVTAPLPPDPPEPMRVILPSPPRPLSGSVVDGVSREPVAGAFVWPEGDPAAFVRTDARGAYTVLPGRGPHRQALQAVSPQHVAALEELAQGPVAPAFVLHPASVVSGAVVEAGGSPVPGAVLQFLLRRDLRGMTSTWHPVASAHSDSQGRFRLRLPAGTSYDVKARHPDFAPASIEILALEPRTPRKDVRIVLGRGHTAFGRVVDAREQPIAGATVTLEPVPDAADLRQLSWRERDGSGFDATTDLAGRFEIRRLPAGRFDLEARAQGYPPMVVRGLAIESEASASVDLGTVILPPGVTVEGTVVDSKGQPIAGADVQVRPLDSLPGRLFHSSRDEVPKSGPDGRFAITALREGQRVELQGWKPGYVAQPTVVEVPPPGPVRLVLTPAVRIAGRVVREDGKPISRAQVYVTRAGSGSGFPTDDQGRFEAREGPGTIDIRATAEGYLPEEIRVEAAAGQDVEDLRIVLRKGAVVTGKVLGSDGAPVPGAEVRAVPPPDGNRFRSPSAPEAKTDGEGRYRLEGVPEGRSSIAASHPELQRAVKDLDVRPGENRLDLQLGRGFPVAGRVVDAEGRPVEGAQVLLSLAPGSGELPRPLKEAASGVDGAFRFSSVEPGTYAVRAAKDGYVPAGPQERVHVAGAPVEGLELRLATGGVLRGRILGLPFERLAGVHVAASRVVSPGTFEEPRQGRVDFEGKYEIRGITPGEWTVGAESGGASTVERITVPEGAAEATLDLDFTGGLTLSGSVLRGGEPVSGLNILAAGRDIDDSGNGTTGDRGEFRLEGLEPGGYTLYLFESGSSGHHQEQVDLSTDREIVIELPNQRVSGRVIDAIDSSPLAGAVISLEGGTRLEATSDRSGVFTVSQVPEGTWLAVARKDGYAPAETTVEVRPGSDVEGVRLALSPGAGLVLEVLAATGNAPPRIFAALQDAAGRTVVGGTYETGEGGRVRIGSAPAGRFRLFVSAAGSATVSLDVTIPGDPVRLTLPAGSHLAVRVPALEGERTAATLTIVDPGGQPLRLLSFGTVLTVAGMSHRGGSFFLDDVPPGTWTVRVSAADGRSWEGTATTKGGRTEIVLE